MLSNENRLSRREMLRRVGMLGAGVLLGTRHLAPQENRTLTAAEFQTLEAIVARLIPSDENGPGAVEAHAAVYIDRALRGALALSREAYSAGLAAINVYAESKKGGTFAKLSPADQDSVLSDMGKNIAAGFAPSSVSFFNLLRSHTVQGTFCDPIYGGNADFVGWNLIGYPGVRLSVSREQQRMGISIAPVRRSAYDHEMFARIGVQLR